MDASSEGGEPGACPESRGEGPGATGGGRAAEAISAEGGAPRPASVLARIRKRARGLAERAAALLEDLRLSPLRLVEHLERTAPGRPPLRAVTLNAGRGPEGAPALLDPGRFERRPARAASRSEARRLMARADLAVVRGPSAVVRRLASQVDLVVPEWVDQRLDLSGSLRDVEARFRETVRVNELRLIRRYRFTPRVVRRAPEALREFHEEMYLPYAAARHGEGAVRAPLERHRVFFEMGELLLVEEGGAAVAGAVGYERGGSWFMRAIGVRGADLGAVRRGAVAALYCFAIREAHARGCRWIDFRLSRPFLSDGVFWHKRKWGAEARATPEVARSRVRLGSLGPAVQALLAERPLIVLAGAGLAAIGSGAPGDPPLDAAGLRALRARWETPGIARILWLAPAGVAPDAEAALERGEGGSIDAIRAADIRPAEVAARLSGRHP